MNFLFIIRKDHSKFFSGQNYNAFEVQNLLPTEVVTVKVKPRKSPLIRIESEDFVRRFLDDLFKKILGMIWKLKKMEKQEIL